MKIGTITFSTMQGIAMLARDFYRHGIITDPIIIHHSRRPNHPEWYPECTPYIANRPMQCPEIIQRISETWDAAFFIETPFDWELIEVCKRAGVKTVVMPMYECMPKNVPTEPDVWCCPSLLDVEYYPGSPFIPVPVEVKWEQRTIAHRFLHNGGHLGLHGHKGTLELLQAIEHIKSPLELTIRAQDLEGFEKLLRQEPYARTDPRVTIEMGEIPYDNLFTDYDVLVQPEKYNGLSLPLQEAYASGMMVMTSDRFPHNTWLPIGIDEVNIEKLPPPAYFKREHRWRRSLIPVQRYFKTSVSGRCNEFDEAVIDPKDIAAKIDEWYGQDIKLLSHSGKEWAQSYSWEKLKPRYMEVLS